MNKDMLLYAFFHIFIYFINNYFFKSKLKVFLVKKYLLNHILFYPFITT